MQSSGGSSLAATLAAWNPRFRRIRIALTVLAIAAGFTVFAENSVLAALSISIRDQALSFHGEGDSPAWRQAFSQLELQVGALGFSRPLAMLTLFIVLRLSRIGTDAWGRMLLSRLQIRSREEVESEVLTHLQRQSDDFYGSRPIAEILSRLSADVDRALDARDAYIRLFRLAVMILGNLYFFSLQDWRLAAAGIVTCVMGALWMDRMAWPVGRTEKLLLERDERVRSHFEDLLRAAPEVQVGNLFRQSREYLGQAQEVREPVFNRVAWLDARLNAVQGVAALLGMAALFLVTLYFLAAQSPEAGVALVPIILKALPELFANASAVVLQRLSLVRSRTSIQRLLEFDSTVEPHVPTGVRAPVAAPLRFVEVSYHYPSPLGIPQGGVHSISTEFSPGRWIAVVGPTGAGKSTLLQLVLGRLQPQTGSVLHGDVDLRLLSPEDLASIHSFMPQRLSILDTTIRDNITFGRSGLGDQPLPPGELAVLDAAGLSDLCRRKALDMVPRPEELGGNLGQRILHLRAEAWKGLARLGIGYRKYGDGPADPRHWVLEHLLEGRSDRATTVDRLLSPISRRPLRRMMGTPLGDALLEQGHRTLQACRSILRLPTYQQFARLSPFFLDERTWQLWTATHAIAEASLTSKAESAMLMSVALTSAGAGSTGEEWRPRPEWASGIATLRSLFGPQCAPFKEAAINPFLTWRENLLFAAVELRNDRIETRVEQMVLDLLDAEGLTNAFTEVGLRFSVGRSGSRLSGGQAQLVALSRTLLRGTPLVVLDEPTSALDPTSRTRVAQLLHAWKKNRIIITTSHDPEFVRNADEIRLIERGRLVRSGTYEDLLKESDTLRNLLRLEPPAGSIGAAIRRAL